MEWWEYRSDRTACSSQIDWHFAIILNERLRCYWHNIAFIIKEKVVSLCSMPFSTLVTRVSGHQSDQANPLASLILPIEWLQTQIVLFCRLWTNEFGSTRLRNAIKIWFEQTLMNVRFSANNKFEKYFFLITYIF